MDIIDIMLAKAMTPQGKTDAYVAKANKAAQKAVAAEAAAESAAATLESAATTITETQSAAATLLETAQAALATAQQAQGELPTAYGTTGQNVDGYMTQKAVTDALATKADSSTLNLYVTTTDMNSALTAKANASDLTAKADKTYVDQQIAQIPSGGGSGSSININLNSENAGHMVVVDENGGIAASVATEAALVEALLNTGTHVAKDAVGLDIDYINQRFKRTQEASNYSMGSDFDKYSMYGGRTRCNVLDDGTITAFYGDNNYTEDGSNGQVMVYQPKFYYKRVIRESELATRGSIIRHETLLISPTEQVGFKLAPAFFEGLDYILLPAFDAGLVNDKLTSIAGVKPITNITIEQAETYAVARGTGWHIMNMAAESANQMLEMIEFGHMNGQNAIELGISYAPNGSNNNCFFITGSTSSLGNQTGHAESTQVDINGSISTMTANGYRAISYRGMENPWGNLWSMIGGITIVGDGAHEGGQLYVCNDFNYNYQSVGNNYGDIGFNLPGRCSWINAMGYGNEQYDWVYIPIECAVNANSLLPVGDSLWTTNNLNTINIAATGGSYGFKEECGPFYYGFDRQVSESARINYGAKLLYIPTKNATYTANIAKWNTYMGG